MGGEKSWLYIRRGGSPGRKLGMTARGLTETLEEEGGRGRAYIPGVVERAYFRGGRSKAAHVGSVLMGATLSRECRMRKGRASFWVSHR